jgi:hypothetical protein
MKIKSASPNRDRNFFTGDAGVEQSENTSKKEYTENMNIPDNIFSIVSSDKVESSKAEKTIRQKLSTFLYWYT